MNSKPAAWSAQETATALNMYCATPNVSRALVAIAKLLDRYPANPHTKRSNPGHVVERYIWGLAVGYTPYPHGVVRELRGDDIDATVGELHLVGMALGTQSGPVLNMQDSKDKEQKRKAWQAGELAAVLGRSVGFTTKLMEKVNPKMAFQGFGFGEPKLTGARNGTDLDTNG